MSENTLRPDLETPPPRIAALPVRRGYPVPWFVAWVNGEPEFRAMDPEKLVTAIKHKRCWVCGEPLGKFMTFVVGPMCGINRTSAEPPSHKDCAQWSARNCPFLSKPQMTRREGEMLGGGIGETPAGVMIKRNPGVTLLWTTKSYQLFGDGNDGVLIRIGAPEGIEWWALGKPATRAQVEESVRSGLPNLERMAELEPGAMDDLRKKTASLETLYPKE